jgi:hypothetical protein
LSASWRTAYHQRRFAVLFGSLVVCIVASPIANAVGLGRDPVETFLALALVTALLGEMVEGRWHALAALVALFAVARALHLAFGVAQLLPAGEALWAAAGVAVAITALRATLRDGVLSLERIYAALSVYLMAGLVFGVLYRTLERLEPGSIRVLVPAGGALDLPTAIYFSFVTLTTLGYGDVVAASPMARAMAILEAAGGQLFVAVLIARLVSLHAQAATRR